MRSWVEVGDTEVLLFGDDPGVAEAAHELGVRHIPAVRRNATGRPYLDSVFTALQQTCSNDAILYVNADIVLTDDIKVAMKALLATFQVFLLVARRTEISIDSHLEFGGNWQRTLRTLVAAEGLLAPPYAIDCFGFVRGSLAPFPPFLVGRPGWDNWMVYQARERRVPVVDCTADVLLVHQDVEPGYARGKAWNWDDEESAHNLRLAGWGRYFDVDSATHQLVNGVVRRQVPPSLGRWWTDITKADPRMRSLVAPARSVIRRARQMALGPTHPDVTRRIGPPAPPESW